MFALEMQPKNKEAISKLGLVRFQRGLFQRIRSTRSKRSCRILEMNRKIGKQK